jgi:hypothetical protein
MDCRYLDEYYELYLLGTISGDVCATIREHALNHCPYCLERLREAVRAVYLLSQPARTVRPDPKRKLQLLRHLPRK